ncbi:cysteine hydrolase family protein [Ruminococcus albus]|nr:isochorismatase family cysteine hydrolase [Ruminococcus albus]
MKKALMVIDMQNDYLWEKRKSKFAYDTEQLVASVNRLIHEYSDSGNDVIYIRHIIQDLPTNRLLFGFSIAGTEGAELYSGVDIVSELCFDKLFGDAFTNKQLLALFRKNSYDELHICGIDEYGCVTSTACGAVKRHIPVRIIRSGTATVFTEKKAAKYRKKLETAGVEYI